MGGQAVFSGRALPNRNLYWFQPAPPRPGPLRASLGDATTPGLWLETPLVNDQGTGWVIGENGMSVPLTLRPSGGERGSGSRMSMAVYQELGLSLTALPTITVLSDG